jgi:hypothetical protein
VVCLNLFLVVCHAEMRSVDAKGGAHVRARDHCTRKCCVPRHVSLRASAARRCSLTLALPHSQCNLVRAFTPRFTTRSLGTHTHWAHWFAAITSSLSFAPPPSLPLSLPLARSLSPLSYSHSHSPTHPPPHTDWRRGHGSAPSNHWRLFPAGPPRQVSCARASTLNPKPCRGSTGVRQGLATTHVHVTCR